MLLAGGFSEEDVAVQQAREGASEGRQRFRGARLQRRDEGG